MGTRTNVSVRALLRDADGCLVLIRRERPGRAPYWVTPGGGLESDDASLEDALRRELREELGAEATLGEVVATWTDDGVTTHLFAATLVSMDRSLRHGPELDDPDPARGTYEVVRIPVTREALDAINLVPDYVSRVLPISSRLPSGSAT
ncbi:MAG: NUDIX domain-containing protein [Thermomicrobiales bacterium]